MKILLLFFKIFRWSLGTLFLIISLTVLLQKEYVASIIVLILSLIIIPFTLKIILKFFKKINIDFSGFEKIIHSLDYSNSYNIIPIYEESISQRKKPISNKQKIKIGKKIYYNALKHSVKDFHISNDEIENLNKISDYFNLSKENVSYEKRKLAERTLKLMIQQKYNDKVLTDAENEEIINLATFMEFPFQKVEEIKNKLALSILNIALDEKISDRYLSPTEESELNNLVNSLKIDNDSLNSIISNKKLKNLAYAKLLWKLENGIFATIYNPPINLKKNEQCYLGFNAQLLETKIVHKGYTSSSSGVSIKIAKGVRYRVGSSRSRPIKEEITIKNPGNLFLTNERVVFTGGNKSFQIPFTKLLTFDVYSDGIDFIMERKNYLLQLEKENIEIFAVGLSSAIRQCMNHDDETKLIALEEIENNQTFIDIH